MRVVLLPGMDGTGRLFERFRAALPETWVTSVVDYGEAVTDEELLRRVPLPDEPFAIVAESFSGPLAMRIAASAPAQLAAVVLVATFVRRPRALPRWLVAVLSRLVFALTPPRWVLRWLLLDRAASPDEANEVHAILASIPRKVLGARLRRVFATDRLDAFRRCTVPMIYLQALRDRLVPARVLEELLSLRPELAHVSLEGPHLLLQRRATESAAVVKAFLERVG